MQSVNKVKVMGFMDEFRRGLRAKVFFDMAIVGKLATAPEHGEHFGFSHLPVNQIAASVPKPHYNQESLAIDIADERRCLFCCRRPWRSQSILLPMVFCCTVRGACPSREHSAKKSVELFTCTSSVRWPIKPSKPPFDTDQQALKRLHGQCPAFLSKIRLALHRGRRQ